MGNIKNVLLHCMENEEKYRELNLLNDEGRLINKGWIEAIEFTMNNFDITEKTIERE